LDSHFACKLLVLAPIYTRVTWHDISEDDPQRDNSKTVVIPKCSSESQDALNDEVYDDTSRIPLLLERQQDNKRGVLIEEGSLSVLLKGFDMSTLCCVSSEVAVPTVR
jgi:hypothetical protein